MRRCSGFQIHFKRVSIQYIIVISLSLFLIQFFLKLKQKILNK
jgi:hypothetical protein